MARDVSAFGVGALRFNRAACAVADLRLVDPAFVADLLKDQPFPLEIAVELEFELIRWIVRGTAGAFGKCFIKAQSSQIQLGDVKIDNANEVILGDQLFQRDRKQAGLAAGLSLDVGHNEKCSVSFDTEHFL
ncbi:hypothetical protein ASG55_11205 [Pseudomonas sp. Leaf434]|nr:hypothetical protein ASG55_11205 [Pseudomonas sp. Leaf434]